MEQSFPHSLRKHSVKRSTALWTRLLSRQTVRSFEKQANREFKQALTPLLDYLAAGDNLTDEQWNDWHISQVHSGTQNLLYRTTNVQDDFAVKFIKPTNHRAWREYGSLLALDQAGLSIAPKPVMIESSSYFQPVIVMTWLKGDASYTSPTEEAEWISLIEHYASIHRLTPENTGIRLPSAFFNANSVEAAKELVCRKVTSVSVEASTPTLMSVVHRWEASPFPDLENGRTSLCRSDANIHNFVRRQDKWASVDWEYGGWGDPAFEIAGLLTQPTLIGITSSRTDWIINTYCELMGDMNTATRIQTFYKMMVVWWAARYALALYNTPLDEPKYSTRRAKYKHYINLADTLF